MAQLVAHKPTSYTTWSEHLEDKLELTHEIKIKPKTKIQQKVKKYLFGSWVNF